MAGRSTPSNASVFSPELQTFVVTKYDPLLAIVRELNTRLQASEKERMRLERRVQRLEHQVVDINDAVEKGGGLKGKMDLDKDIPGRNAVQELLESEEALVSPWLFSCQTGTPTSALQVLLEFSPESTLEIDSKMWKRESSPFDAQNLCSFWTCVEQLAELCLSSVEEKLSFSCEMSLGVARPPIIRLQLHSLRIEAGEPEALGRVALVLEGNDIGSRLRAGRRRFRIEPLN